MRRGALEPSGSCAGGRSCGSPSWSAGWGWTAAIPGRRLEGGDRGEGGRKAREEGPAGVRAGARQGPQAGRAARPPGEGLERDPDPGEAETAGPPAECRSCTVRWTARPRRRRGGRRSSTSRSSGKSPSSCSPGWCAGAAGRSLRGRPGGLSPGLRLLRPGAERRRRAAVLLRERSRRAVRAAHRHADRAGRLGRLGGQGRRAGERGLGRPGSTRPCSPRWPPRTSSPPTRPR